MLPPHWTWPPTCASGSFAETWTDISTLVESTQVKKQTSSSPPNPSPGAPPEHDGLALPSDGFTLITMRIALGRDNGNAAVHRRISLMNPASRDILRDAAVVWMRHFLVALALLLCGCSESENRDSPAASPGGALTVPSAETPSLPSRAPSTEAVWHLSAQFDLSMTEVDASSGGIPFAQGQGANCIVLRDAGSEIIAVGNVTADWEPTPTTAELELSVRHVGADYASRTGPPPITIAISGEASADAIEFFLGAPPGGRVAIRQDAILEININYSAEHEGEVLQGNCVRGG